MRIALTRFGGLMPKIADLSLPEDAARAAINCNIVSGALRPWREPANVGSLFKTGTIQGLYRYEGAYWFHWLNPVKAVRSPLATDPWGRVYFVDGTPQMTANDVALAGSDHPAVTFALGVPQPLSAPSFTVTGEGEGDEETRFYVYTYMTRYGEESVPSTPSGLVTMLPGQTVNLSGMAGIPAGNTVITQKRIYRVNTGSEQSAYQLVATIPADQGTYEDTVSSGDLSIVLESAEYNEPPATLQGLITLPNGSLCGFSGTELCFSEPYRPHAWPLRYRIPCEYPIVSIGAFLNMILVTTEGLPSLVVGETPGAMTRDKLEIGQACVSARGMVDMGYSLIYPGPDGLAQIGQGKFSVVTGGIMSKEEWDLYNPSSIHAYIYDGKYLAFYDNGTPGAFIFDPEAQVLVELDMAASGGFADPANGELFLVQGQDVMQFNADGDFMEFTWLSKPFYTPPTNFGACCVWADDYPLEVTVYVDDFATHTFEIDDPEPVRIPSGYRGRKWQFEIQGSVGVNMFAIAHTVGELGL